MCSASNIRREYAPSWAVKRVSLRIVLALLLGSIFLFASQQLRAQSEDSQQNNQDVAEAARQERARKQQPSSKHIYTNEDLRRGRILTPEDESRVAAKRKQIAPLATQPDAEPLDASSNTPREPLGDVARRYRNVRRNPQKTSPFHLPSQQPELAAPETLAPLAESVLKPAPKNFVPARPSTSLHGTHRLDPFSRRPGQLASPSISAVLPAEPRTRLQPDNAPPESVRVSRPHSTSSSSESIVIREGDTLWTLSRQHLGRGTRWLELMAANPGISDPNRLVPGTPLTLPPRIATHHSKFQTITIQAGDTLSKIALAAYGHASIWPCIAQANPTLFNPHQLSIGRSLTLPAFCSQ